MCCVNAGQKKAAPKGGKVKTMAGVAVMPWKDTNVSLKVSEALAGMLHIMVKRWPRRIG
jgi:hypothetical protein